MEKKPNNAKDASHFNAEWRGWGFVFVDVMKKKERGIITDIILKAFNYLTIRYWIVIIIPTLVVEVAMYIINNLFFQVFFAIVLAIATIATIAILVQSRKIENLILIKAKEPIVDEVCWDGIINDETPCYYII